MAIVMIKARENIHRNNKKVYWLLKRVFDVSFSAIALILLALPMVLITVLIKLESPGPAIFVHNRYGKNGRPLPLLKFRSMHMNAEHMIDLFTPEQKEEWEQNFKLENDPRITRIGSFLRRTSLDELPQFINILKGDLSVVGPRPIVEDELARYGSEKDKFLSVTPGLTGYWQAYARSTCTYEQRMEMELYYVDHANFWWDIKIMLATVVTVLSRRGAK